MLKKTIIGFMLALFAGPLAAHAELPGQPCQKEQIGTTKMADDKQNIIACLITDDGQSQQWKAMHYKNPSYSLTCTDWQAKGHDSMDDCIRDGRWHKVYEHDSSGKRISGDFNKFVSYVVDGADVKSGGNGTSKCQAASYRNGVVLCLDPVRFAGDTMGNPQSGSPWGLGVWIRRTNGTVTGVNIVPTNNANVNGGPLNIITQNLPNAGFSWWVKF